ncbi:MAG: metallophosphoesterase [Candidatus Eisenbacteria sp.]|nr:metallophosphoesterase [Candidatus Eisenbacteria bacterium]
MGTLTRRSFMQGSALAAAAAWRAAHALPFQSARPGSKEADYFRAINMVGRVTGERAIVSLVTAENLTTCLRCRVRWSTSEAGVPGSQSVSPVATTESPNERIELVLTGLEPSTRYVYRVEFTTADAPDHWQTFDELGEFRSQRPGGETFDFCLVADAHWGHRDFDFEMSSAWGYNAAECLRQVLKDGETDFCVDLGDSTYLVGTDSQEDALRRYAEYRRVMAPLMRKMPVFYVLGNHEQECGFNQRGDDGTISTMPLGNHLAPDQYQQKWATHARLTFIPNPRGDTYPEGGEGAPGVDTSAEWAAGTDPWNDGERENLQNFYAWTWGDALCVVLDPYRYTLPGKFRATTSPSDWTLGPTQLAWLAETLANSSCRWKFIFAHHQVGGGLIGIDGQPTVDGQGRAYGRGSGVEAARGDTEQAVIHGLMKRHDVQFFVYGHDHCFCHSVWDGVHYVCCGRPTYLNPWFNKKGTLSSYGNVIRQGHDQSWIQQLHTVLGYVRFRVSPHEVRMEWIRTGFSFRPNGPCEFNLDHPQRDWLECWAGRSYSNVSSDRVVVARVPRDVDGVRSVREAAIHNFFQAPAGSDYYRQPIPTRPEAYSTNVIPVQQFPAGGGGPAIVDYVPETIYSWSLTEEAAAATAEAGRGADLDAQVMLGALRGEPNPFRGGTRITFTSAAALAQVEARIHDAQGRLVRSLAIGHLPPGHHEIFWDGRGHSGTPLGKGVYFARVTAGGEVSAPLRLVLIG